MKSWQQNLIPQHLLSHLMGKLANARWGSVTRFGIKKFIDHYHVNMNEAKISDYTRFETFNDFFTRELKAGVRALHADKNRIISPVDGCVSECGHIEKDQLLQAKGAYFSVNALCGGDASVAEKFYNGSFLTAYLSPKDYHRFHMPLSGKLKKMIYVPGKLFSVNESSVKNVSGLFAKNERVICIFETGIGDVALIAVGAMIVGSMSMKWHGIVNSGKTRRIMSWNYQNQSFLFQRGDEVGHFRLGSTVILLFEQNKMSLDVEMVAGKSLQLGESIGRVLM